MSDILSNVKGGDHTGTLYQAPGMAGEAESFVFMLLSTRKGAQ